MSDNVIQLNFKDRSTPLVPQPNLFYNLVYNSLKSMAPDCKLREMVAMQTGSVFHQTTEEMATGLSDLFSRYDYIILDYLKELGIAEIKEAGAFFSTDIRDGNLSFAVDCRLFSESALILAFELSPHLVDVNCPELKITRPTTKFELTRKPEELTIPSGYCLENVIAKMQKHSFQFNELDLVFDEYDDNYSFIYRCNGTDHSFSCFLILDKKHYLISKTK